MTHELGVNDILIKFNVSRFVISRVENFSIPSMTQNYVYVQFAFDDTWQGLEPTAILSRDTTVHQLPLDENNIAKVPNDLLTHAGTIIVSAFAGDLRTVNETHIQVMQSGFRDEAPPPQPPYVFVKTPDNSVPYIREIDHEFEYYSTETDEFRGIVLKDDLELGVW